LLAASWNLNALFYTQITGNYLASMVSGAAKPSDTKTTNATMKIATPIAILTPKLRLLPLTCFAAE
jgi:hypothetical protein